MELETKLEVETMLWWDHADNAKSDLWHKMTTSDHPTFGVIAQPKPVFGPEIHFDLNYTPVKVLDCIWHGTRACCDGITPTTPNWTSGIKWPLQTLLLLAVLLRPLQLWHWPSFWSQQVIKSWFHVRFTDHVVPDLQICGSSYKLITCWTRSLSLPPTHTYSINLHKCCMA